MGDIGQQLRQSSQQRGPGGEMTSFEELGRIAANMGRMGMAENVRSVKDFNEKFKTMLKTVKTVATELGTSLEDAQKLMASLKGSGVFRGQGQFAGALRAGSLAGRVSTAELSGAAMVGSQISRGVGGLGKSGAYAGIEAMTQVGAARQAGVISEEDIYNSTGMSGAEGRRGWVQQQMSADARFFSRGIGRRALAAMSGKDGQLDQDDVERFKSGGVGTGETMQMAHQNLAGIGRAGFIRNEGRLRGEAMRAFGGLGRAVVARNWLESRGMDMSSDRSMLFFQRKFKVGRDEADQMMKMARNLPRIQAERRQAGEDDQYMRDLESQEREQSPTEMMKKLEASRQEVNNSLRQMGADFYKSGSQRIDEFMKKLTGGYEKRTRRNLSAVIDRLYTGKETFAEQDMGADDPLAQQARQEIYGGAGESVGKAFNRFAAGAGAKWKAAGYDIGGADDAQQFQQLRGEARGMSQAYRRARGGAGISADVGSQIRTLVSSQQTLGRGKDAISQFEGIVQKLGGTPEGAKLLKRWNSAKTDQDKSRIMGEVYSDKNVKLKGLLADQMDVPGGLSFLGPQDQFATEDARSLAIGEAALGEAGSGLTASYSYGTGKRPDLPGYQGAQTVLTALERGTRGGLMGDLAAGAQGLFGGTVGALNEFQKEIGIGGARGKSLRAGVAGAVGAPRGLLAGMGEGLRGALGIEGRQGLLGDEGLIGGALKVGEDFISGHVAGALGGEATDTQRRAYGEYLKGEEGMGLMGDIYKGDRSARRDAKERIQTLRLKAKKAAGGKPLTGAAEAEDKARAGMLAGAAFAEWRSSNPTVPVGDIDWKEVAAKSGTGMSAAQVKAAVSAQSGTLGAEHAQDQLQKWRGLKTRAERDMDEEAADVGRETRVAEYKGGLKSAEDVAAWSQGASYVASVREERELMAQLDTSGDEGAYEGNQEIEQRIDALRAGRQMPTSVAGKRKMAKQLRLEGMTDEAAAVDRDAGVQKGLSRFRGTARGARAAQLAGIDVKASELKGKSIEDQLGVLWKKSGVGRLDDLTGKDKAKLKEQMRRALGSKTLTQADIDRGAEGKVGDVVKTSADEQRDAVAGLGGRKEISQGARKRQDDAAAQSDPSFRALQSIERAIGQQTNDIVTAISNIDAGEGEGGGSPKPKPKKKPA